ncbi:MAG: cytochrome C oxidase subunit IV family protein [Acidimicrobiia bacterium]
MSETAQTQAHHHPTPRQYVQIAVLLAVLTGIEVGLYYTAPTLGKLVTPALLILAATKFGLVVGYYMHLKYEKRLLTGFFGAGFVLAGVIYAVVLVSFLILPRIQ